MVNLPAARRPHRSRIAYAFGLLALLGAATTLMVLIRDPALSSSRLAEPVPAPEITVVDGDPMGPDDMPGAWDGFAPRRTRPAHRRVTRPRGTEAPTRHRTLIRAHPPRPPVGHTREEVSRSLFWSGVFGLAISLAGLGLVGTRRRMW